MKSKAVWACIILIQIGFIALYLYKESLFVSQLFAQQRLEKRKQALLEEKSLLTQSLCAIQQRSSIKKFAQESLGMKSIQLSQMKTLVINEHTQ